jgi:hypothetical protein
MIQNRSGTVSFEDAFPLRTEMQNNGEEVPKRYLTRSEKIWRLGATCGMPQRDLAASMARELLQSWF